MLYINRAANANLISIRIASGGSKNSAMATPSQSQLLLHILVLLATAGAAIADEQHELLPITRPGCADKCGNISIPFPFGLNRGCSRVGFEVTCNDSFQPPRAFLSNLVGGSAQITTSFSYSFSKTTGNLSIVDQYKPDVLPVELIDISVDKNEARAYGAVASVCNMNATDGILRTAFTTLGFLIDDGPNGPFLVSLARNVLVGVGVQVQPLMYKYSTTPSPQVKYLLGCHSSLWGNLELASNGSCSGRGCCQASLPETTPLAGVSVEMLPMTLNNSLWINNPCSFAMVVEDSWYNFSTTDLYGNTSNKFPRGVPYVIDFAIRNAKCPAKGQQPPLDYACVSGNSTCADVTNGYVCKCLEHYEGNPYILNGCQDIDECKRPDLYPCSSNGICKNRLLGYDCPCRPGMKGDGKKGTCHDAFPLVAKIVVGVIGGFFVMAALFFLNVLRKEKIKMKEFYEKNGGPILEKTKIIKLFKKKELKDILQRKNLIGNGSFGKVYKGLLDNKEVVVKKHKSGGAPQNQGQFANEVIIQSQVIHKNIVRLIGCCLEVKIPMLVYEFFPKGSLDDILHGKNKVVPLSIDVRLSIAAQSADGLAYMHSKTNYKIIHGNVKPGNILLDDNFTPKVSEFGASRLIARDEGDTDNANRPVPLPGLGWLASFRPTWLGWSWLAGLASSSQPNRANNDTVYLDPVCIQTNLRTEKGDVYSFGVVILELLSRKKATNSNNLVGNFLEAHKEKGVTELFDNEIAVTDNLELLYNLAKIVVECLNLDVNQRPSMIDVAECLLKLNQSRSP